MKVLCIDDKPRPGDILEAEKFLFEGKVYSVIKETIGYDDAAFTVNPVPCYILAEDPGWGYEINRFIPVSDIDETEMERSYSKKFLEV